MSPVAPDAFLREVLDGLCQPQKRLPGKYIWDEAGSAIFARIVEAPDYYLGRREVALTRARLPEIAAAAGPVVTIVEFGSGASMKVRALLQAMPSVRRYVALDISEEHLRAGTERIGRDHGIEAIPIVADYTRPLPPLPLVAPTLGYFAGSTIGNFPPDDAVALLARFRAALGPSAFLVGVDPNRDPATLRAAYSGELFAGLHKNLLVRLNRELGADFDPDAFRHEARVLADPFRVEAHLVATRDARVRVGDATIAIQAGESIFTDASYKYAPEAFAELAARAGWQAERRWDDPDGLFDLHLLRCG
ncbi:MAG TPA: L-histidine N(alpha)-methyltransferase [Beijerinckiaceae bacterium]|nr:L-histidine N(alpha)-methyltransferase [Beijerinckiaceae bacterium]